MTDQRPYSRKIRCEVAATVVTKLEDDGSYTVKVTRAGNMYPGPQCDSVHAGTEEDAVLKALKLAGMVEVPKVEPKTRGCVMVAGADRMSPVVLKLRHRQSWEGIAARCRANIYLVGSYLTDPENALDVDIIAALPQDGSVRWFDRLKAQIKLSESLSKDTGLPIDFKIQSRVQFMGTSAELPTLLLAEPGVPVEDIYYHDYESLTIQEIRARANAFRIRYGWSWDTLSNLLGTKPWSSAAFGTTGLTVYDLIRYYDWVIKQEVKDVQG